MSKIHVAQILQEAPILIIFIRSLVRNIYVYLGSVTEINTHTPSTHQ